MNNPETSLPPGFRFHPTDEELILHYLRNKGTSILYPVSIIAEVDIYKFDPWELPDKAAFGEKEWYFFSPRDRKYPNGARPNRAAASGYWKATGTDKPIVASIGGQENIGVKKALVFYKGRPPKGIKTNWIMHEYRLTETPNYKPTKLKDSSMRLDDFVLCRIYKKPNSLPTMTMIDKEQENSSIQDVLFNNQNTLKSRKSSSFSNLFDAMDYSILTRFLSDNPTNPTSLEHGDVVSYNNPDQPIFNNCTKTNNNNNNNGSSNNNCSNYMFQNFPQMDSSVSMLENHLKRQHSMEGITDENVLHPSKRLNNLGSFTNNPYESDSPQYHLLNQTFYNQQLLLSSHLQFQR